MTRACLIAAVSATIAAGGYLAVDAIAEPPVTGQPATVYKTVTETTTTASLYQGKPLHWWAKRAVVNRLDANQQHANSLARGRTIRRLNHDLERKFEPQVGVAVALARIVYGVDQSDRVRCESHGNIWAQNNPSRNSPRNILQFMPSTWATTPYASVSIWDPYAAALAGGWMTTHGRSGEWSCGL